METYFTHERREQYHMLHLLKDNQLLTFNELAAENPKWNELGLDKVWKFGGRAPVWAYGLLAFTAVKSGATLSAVSNPATEDLELSDKPSLGGNSSAKWYEIEHQAGHQRAFLHFLECPEGNWEVDSLRSSQLMVPKGVNSILISGRASVWMYTWIAIKAASLGLHEIGFEIPTEPFQYWVTADGHYRCEEKRGNRSTAPGIVIGIIGDPNSGKSVLAKCLQALLRRRINDAWVFDSDFASPTPDWYIRMVSTGAEEGTQLRKDLKRQWSQELHDAVKNRLVELKKSLSLTIADFPGGLHTGEGPPQRIPRGREKILKEADAFILIGRSDKMESFKEWRTDLEAHGLSGRIVGEIISHKPEDKKIDLRLKWEGGQLKGEAYNLDRGSLQQKLLPDDRAVDPILQLVDGIRLMEVAKASCARAFLTKDGGVRYGAAVATSEGKCFSSGQYSSFNHSTNIHAEMGALLIATMHDQPDVRLLALASSQRNGFARPCGVCRQVMLEHCQRTGHELLVIMAGEAGQLDFRPLSELLPFQWESHRASESKGCRAPQQFTIEGDNLRPSTGCYFWMKREGLLGIVWDGEWSKTKVLVKLKYQLNEDGAWEKLPHSFTESNAFRQWMSGLSIPYCRKVDTLFEVPIDSQACLRIPLHKGHSTPVKFQKLMEGAGLSPENYFLGGSRSLSGNCSNSDFDVVVNIKGEHIHAFRNHLATAFREGILSRAEASATAKKINALVPGGYERALRELRFADTFMLQEKRYSLLFRPPEEKSLFESDAPELKERLCAFGEVGQTSEAGLKRSRFYLLQRDGSRLPIICYHRLGNLVLEGDMVSVTGWKIKVSGQECLLMIDPMRDRLVWMLGDLIKDIG